MHLGYSIFSPTAAKYATSKILPFMKWVTPDPWKKKKAIVEAVSSFEVRWAWTPQHLQEAGR